MKILVVKDSAGKLSTLVQHIEKMGITPVPARTVPDALGLFVSERPDLALIDIDLPDIGGFELARRIRQLEKPTDWTPIVFLSAPGDDENLEKGIAAGGDDYLQKPVGAVALGAKIRTMQRIIQMRQSLLVMTRKLDTANHELRRLASLDGLTGIANRRHFDAVLEDEWRRAMRQGRELSILMCDIDHFKEYNDRYGHPGGDECLRQVARILDENMVRGGDLLARYGGEEFVAVLPETSLEGAASVAERMRQAILQLKLPHSGSPFGHLTASFGIASAAPTAGSDPGETLAAADKALYRAKQAGRNRVAHAERSE